VAVAQYSESDYKKCLNDEDIALLCKTKVTNPDCEIPYDACRPVGEVYDIKEICNSLPNRLTCTPDSIYSTISAGFSLDWSNCGISNIDYEFDDNSYSIYGHYFRMKRIVLSYNNLTSVPKDFFRSDEVILSHNSIESLPKWNSFFSDTVYYYAHKIDLSYNKLQSLPSGWDAFYSLESLILRNNSLKSLPSDLNESSSLTYLDISYNNFRRIVDMPSSLKFLDASHNRIRRVGESIGVSFPTYLDFSSNVIKNYSLGRCSRFSVNLDDNCLDCEAGEVRNCSCLQETQGGSRCKELENLEALSGIALGMGWTFQSILILSVFVTFALMVSL